MFFNLVGLALVDSIGVGTLVVPLWMMVRPSFRVQVVLLHLGVLGLLYLGVGITLLTVVGDGSAAFMTHAVPGDAWVRLAVGGVVLLAGLVCDRRRRRPSGAWWMRAPAGAQGVVLLAVAVGAVEVATMLPYFAAIEAVAASGRGWTFSVSILAVYVFTTLLPALVLLAARVAASQLVSSLLRRLMHRVERWSQDVVGTVLIVVGALLVADAAVEMNLV
ncbi:GAP family protein [Rhodococcus sp. IEGM 1381]|uniref:GAP family protein n=1 Tax=Rhodococcus sp. IEGM 1381 TaxID=3047085 RepID=UPI0024B69E3C|nr:GAP family protein [Rhodococcus sp. IEGM 1381]MDI9896595.1 GAP family protein [Rhodococcus sp. IEGM 1381]